MAKVIDLAEARKRVAKSIPKASISRVVRQKGGEAKVARAAKATVERISETAGAFFMGDAPIVVPTRAEKLRALQLYTSTFVTESNALAKRFKMQLKLLLDKSELAYFTNSAAIEELTRALIAANWDLKAVAGQVDGWALFPTTIKDAMKLALALREPNDVAFEAETQYGKTIILVMAKLFHTMWIEANGNREVMVLVNPSRVAPHTQTEADEQAATQLHAAIKLAPAGRAAGDVLNEVNTRMRGHVIVKRASVPKIKDIVNAAMSCGKNLITLCIDEADEASGEMSVINKWMNDLNNNPKYKGKIKIRMLLCSATAYQFKFIDTFNVVTVDNLSADSGYSGTFRGARTPVVSYEQINQVLINEGALKAKDNSLADFDLTGWWKASRKQDKDSKALEKAGTNAVLSAIKAFANGIDASWLGLNGKPFNGGQGVMMRFGVGDYVTHLLNSIEDELDAMGLAVVHFHGDNPRKLLKNSRTATKMIEGVRRKKVLMEIASGLGLPLGNKAQIDDALQTASLTLSADDLEARINDTPYIVFVLGAGRRADRFPAHTTVFLDFTNKFSNSVAMEQGTMGRASGWGKITKSQSTVVMVSNDNKEMIDLCRLFFDKTGKKAPINGAGLNTITMDSDDGPVTIRRPKVANVAEIHFDDYPNDRIIQSIRRDYEELIGSKVRWTEGAKTMSGLNIDFARPDDKQDVIEPGYRGIYKTVTKATEGRRLLTHYFDFYSLLTGGRLEHLQKVLRERAGSPDLTILVPGEKGENAEGAWKYDTHDGLHTQLALNNVFRSMHGGTDDQRETTQRKDPSRRDWKKGDAMDRRPNVFFQPLGYKSRPGKFTTKSGEVKDVTEYYDVVPKGGKLVKMSLATTGDFYDCKGFLDAIGARKEVIPEIKTMPRPGTPYYDRASKAQQREIDAKVTANASKTKGKGKGKGKSKAQPIVEVI